MHFSMKFYTRYFYISTQISSSQSSKKESLFYICDQIFNRVANFLFSVNVLLKSSCLFWSLNSSKSILIFKIASSHWKLYQYSKIGAKKQSKTDYAKKDV